MKLTKPLLGFAPNKARMKRMPRITSNTPAINHTTRVATILPWSRSAEGLLTDFTVSVLAPSETVDCLTTLSVGSIKYSLLLVFTF